MNYRPTCARCGRTFEPDVDHVVVSAETRKIRDRNEEEEYYFHADCWREETGGWADP